MNDDRLDAVWQDTLYFLLWSPSVYADFFRRIRTANLKRAFGHRVRVILAEPPVDWETLDGDSFAHWHEQRERAYAERIEQEVLDRGRRAVLIFGLRHLTHYSLSDAPYRPLAERLVKHYPGIIELIHPYHGEKSVFSGNHLFPDIRYNGLMLPAAAESSSGPAMIDHIWYLGDLERRIALPDALFADTTWLVTIVARLQRLGEHHIARARRLMTAPQKTIFDDALARHRRDMQQGPAT